ncbi:heterokaryon incompatibility protein, partial [Colletotrichum sojae]
DATVFHGHLYGIYGILETLKPHFPELRLSEVDYSGPAARIFTELTTFIIESTGNTAVLDSVLARSRVPGAPTWVCGFHNVWTPKYSPPLDDPSDKPVVSADGLRLSITGYIAAAIWIVVPGFKKKGSREIPMLHDGFRQIEDYIVEPVAKRFNLDRKAVRHRVCRGNDALLEYYEDLRLDQSGWLTDEDPNLHSLLSITFGSVNFVTERGNIGMSHIDMTPEVGDYLCYRKGADQPIILYQVSSGTYQVIGPPAWFVENSFHPRCQRWYRVTLEL